MNQIRIAGFGEATAAVIQRVRDKELEGVTAVLAAGAISPTQTDRMIILLIDENSDAALQTARAFHEAGALTIAVTSAGCSLPADSCTSQTVADVSSFSAVVRIILDIILNTNYIALDFNDLFTTLQGADSFKALSGEGQGNDRVAAAIHKVDVAISEYEKKMMRGLIFNLSYNNQSGHPLLMSELAVLPEFIETLSDGIEVAWGVTTDPSLPDDIVRIDFIISFISNN